MVEIDVSAALREKTLREIAELNLAITRYNAVKFPEEPLPTSTAALVDKLLTQGFLLGNRNDLIRDEWGQLYLTGLAPVTFVYAAGTQ